jgi:gluconolactonase
MEMRDSAGKLVEGLYRIDVPDKVQRIIGRELERPNGILVGPEDQYLLVADNNNNAVGGGRKLGRFDLKADGSIEPSSPKVLFDWQTSSGADGFKMDTRHRLFVAAGLNKPDPPFESVEPHRAGIYCICSMPTVNCSTLRPSRSMRSQTALSAARI